MGTLLWRRRESGVPTFAFDVVGVRDSVSNHVSGRLFPFGSVAEISEAIIEAADNPKNLKKSFRIAVNGQLTISNKKWFGSDILIFT